MERRATDAGLLEIEGRWKVFAVDLMAVETAGGTLELRRGAMVM